MSNTFLIRHTMLALIGLALLLQTACNSKKRVVLTDKLINQLQVPEYLENKAAEERRLSIIKEALRQVMQGTGDINGRLNISEWKNPSLIEALLLFDPPVSLLEALKSKGVDLEHFDYESRNSHPSLVGLMSKEASYESLEWLAENQKKLRPHPDRPPYVIIRSLWENERLTKQQLEVLVKTLVPKGLDINERADGETLLHVICQKSDSENEQKDKIDMVEWLFSIDGYINIQKGLHIENQEELVPWEIAYYNYNNDLAATLIRKMTSSMANAKTIKQDQALSNASGDSHLKRLKKWDLEENGYEAIKAAFLSIPGIKSRQIIPNTAGS